MNRPLKPATRVNPNLFDDETNADLMEAIVAGCALIAFADGRVSFVERRRLRGLIRRFDAVRAFNPADIEHTFADLLRHFERDPDFGAAHAWGLVARLAHRPRDAALLVQTCLAIAHADGHYDAQERHTITALSRRLNVPLEEGLLQ